MVTASMSADQMKALASVLPSVGEDEDQRSFSRSLTREMGVEHAYRGAITSASGPLVARTFRSWVEKRHGVPRYLPDSRYGQTFASNIDRATLERDFATAMRAVHRGKVPSIVDAVRTALIEGFGEAWDDYDKCYKWVDRDGPRRALGRMLCGQVDWWDRDERNVQRTGQESGGGGPTYGFTVAPMFADYVMDRARSRVGVWSFANWIPVSGRSYFQPNFDETSSATGSWFGGVQPYVGNGEIFDYQTVSATNDAKLRATELILERNVFPTIISRDLLRDSESILGAIDYLALTTMRRSLERQMILGNLSQGTTAAQVSTCLQSMILAPCTVTVPKASGDSGAVLNKADVDACLGAIREESQQSPALVAIMSSATKATIEEQATNGQWDLIRYEPNAAGQMIPYIKQARVLLSEFCPNVGTTGDIIFADLAEYDLAYRTLSPLDSPLSFSVVQPRDARHLGALGLPPDFLERRFSEHFLWNNDEAIFMFKARMAGRFRLSATSTDLNGNKRGPAAVIATRS